MGVLGDLYSAHPFWVWAAIAAIFLAVEIATGTGWLLWPAASAAVVAVLNLLGLELSLPVELGVFAGLTIVSTLTARRYLPRNIHGDGPDINDPLQRLVGRRGVASSAFIDGRGRADIDGKDWAAELEGGGGLNIGSRVEVTGVVDGARLRVRPA
jgi:inner membrane protein